MFISSPAFTPQLSSRCGTITQPTSTGNQSITGLGFRPNIIYFFSTYQTSAGSDTSQSAILTGVAVSSSNRLASTANIVNGTNSGGNYHYTDRCIVFGSNSAASVLASADLVSMDADGFTINWTVADSTQRIIGYLALGSPKINYAYAGSKVEATATGNQSTTGFGFGPDVVIEFHTYPTATAPPQAVQGAGASMAPRLNFMKSPQERAFSYVALASGGTGNGLGQRTNLCFGRASTAASFLSLADFASMDSGGFTVNWSSVNQARYSFYGGFNGTNCAIGKLDQPGSTGNQSITGLGFTPTAVLFASFNRVANTSAVTGDGDFSIGGATSSSQRWAFGVGRQSATNVRNSRFSDSKCIQLQTTSASVTLNAQADFVSFDTNGFTINWDTVDATAREVIYMALG
jgi:hypothetical protein